jgi:hypothetical protein
MKQIELCLERCQSWLSADESGELRVDDPIEKGSVPEHYGDSHTAAALFVLGRLDGDERKLSVARRITQAILKDWNSSARLKNFHHDFNNFALCIIEESLSEVDMQLRAQIRATVMAATDSRHNTVNWLPMRAYVNRCRYEWTGREKYLAASNLAIKRVTAATNSDGGIEDRLPKGSSYNLQYNISSVSLLLLLKRRWHDLPIVPDLMVSFLTNLVLPDGDINYLGRGANQIFAWGPWLYTLSCTSRLGDNDPSLDYFAARYSISLNNDNILLNDDLGKDKFYWWDYHYCSVYHSHFLLWCALAVRDANAVSVNGCHLDRNDTGLEKIDRVNGGACFFSGRSVYLAEGGPAVCALWLDKHGVLFKGSLGPWLGAFGNKYSLFSTVFQNYLGLMQEGPIKANSFWQVLRRLNWRERDDRFAVVRPVFSNVSVKSDTADLTLRFDTEGIEAYFNVPMLGELSQEVKVNAHVDGVPIDLLSVGVTRGPYGAISVHRSRQVFGRIWELGFS